MKVTPGSLYRSRNGVTINTRIRYFVYKSPGSSIYDFDFTLKGELCVTVLERLNLEDDHVDVKFMITDKPNIVRFIDEDIFLANFEKL